MTRPIHVLGMGADGITSLSSRARLAIEDATFLAGGKRHLALIGPREIETFAITDNLAALVDRLARRGPDERCVVVASGDPLLYGIGSTLLRSFTSQDFVIEPGVSSMQLAFARTGLSWTDAAIASVHGRPIEETLRPLLGRPLIGLFTQDGRSPGRIAEFLLDRGAGDTTAWVCENLGMVEETVIRLDLRELPGSSFQDLNFLILKKNSDSIAADRGLFTLAQGDSISDANFRTPDFGPVLLTHADVRSVTLSRFRELPDGPIWDVGAGLGGVAIDLARRFPTREIVAIERSPRELGLLEENRDQFSAYNLRIVAGTAPEAFPQRPDPAAVFLGGSGGRLDAILDVIFERLVSEGVLVANFVGLENLSRMLERLKMQGWPVDVSQVQISQGQALAGLTTFVPLRPVWIVRSSRPTIEDRRETE